MKKYWILSLLLILTAVILAPAATASDLSLSGTSSVVAGNDFVLSISGGDLLGTVTLSLESGNRPDLKLLAGQHTPFQGLGRIQFGYDISVSDEGDGKCNNCFNSSANLILRRICNRINGGTFRSCSRNKQSVPVHDRTEPAFRRCKAVEPFGCSSNRRSGYICVPECK